MVVQRRVTKLLGGFPGEGRQGCPVAGKARKGKEGEVSINVNKYSQLGWEKQVENCRKDGRECGDG